MLRVIVFVAVLTLPAAFAVSAPPTQESTERSIGVAARKLLRSQQTKMRLVFGESGVRTEDIEAELTDVVIVDGTTTVKVKGKEYENVFGMLPPGWFEPEGGAGRSPVDFGETTATATLALLTAGFRPHTDKRIIKALECLAGVHSAQPKPPVPGAKPNAPVEYELRPGLPGVRAGVLRSEALAIALDRYHVRDHLGGLCLWALKPERERLWEPARQPGEGFAKRYPAGTSQPDWDVRSTAAVLRSAEVNDGTRQLAGLLLDHQGREGAWPAGRTGDAPSFIATVETLTALHHVHGYLPPGDFDRKLRIRLAQALERGHKWLAEHWRDSHWRDPEDDPQVLAAVARLAEVSGAKRFGTAEWWRNAAAAVRYDDDDEEPVRNAADVAHRMLAACESLKFVVINKLKHGAPGDSEAWNRRPRDVANVAHWYVRADCWTNETWQVVTLDPKSEEDLMDAPLLYVSGFKASPWTDRDVAMLRRYVERGGTLVFNPVEGKREFIDDVLALGRRIYPPEQYPERAFSRVPAEHPIYTAERLGKRRAQREDRPPDYHMHDGHRSFAFLFGEDRGEAWQENDFIRKSHAFQTVQWLRQYVTERSPAPLGRLRGEYMEPPAAPKGTIRLGVVKYQSKGTVKLHPFGADAPVDVAVKSDWDSAPLSCRIFHPWLLNETGWSLIETRGVSLAEADLARFDVLHITGHHAFDLSEAERKGLKTFVERGGRVLVDPCGGVTTEFYIAAKGILRDVFPQGVEQMLKDAEPIVGPFRDVQECGLSREVRLRRPDLRNPAEVLWTVKHNGRSAVLLSQFDLTLGIAGQVAWERMGFSTKTTRGLVANFLIGGR